MKSTKITKIVELLFDKCKKKYGADWRNLIVGSSCRQISKYIKPFKYIGNGAQRMTFSYKDEIVFKICYNNKGKANNREYKKYISFKNTNMRYFVSPLLTKVNYKGYTILVYAKAIVESQDTYEDLHKTHIQNEMHNVHSILFDDTHNGNVGKFCKGLVCVDFDYGAVYRNTKHSIGEFIQENANFWKKYTLTYDKTVVSLKKKYKLI